MKKLSISLLLIFTLALSSCGLKPTYVKQKKSVTTPFQVEAEAVTELAGEAESESAEAPQEVKVKKDKMIVKAGRYRLIAVKGEKKLAKKNEITKKKKPVEKTTALFSSKKKPETAKKKIKVKRVFKKKPAKKTTALFPSDKPAVEETEEIIEEDIAESAGELALKPNEMVIYVFAVDEDGSEYNVEDLVLDKYADGWGDNWEHKYPGDPIVIDKSAAQTAAIAINALPAGYTQWVGNLGWSFRIVSGDGQEIIATSVVRGDPHKNRKFFVRDGKLYSKKPVVRKRVKKYIIRK